MSMIRRVFLRTAMAGSAIGAAVGAGLLAPRVVLAAWPDKAFKAESVGNALQGLYGGEATTASGDIRIKAPDIAENGAVVPVTVTAALPGVESIDIIADQNLHPLAASFVVPEGTDGYVATRIKLLKTSKVVAVVKAGGKLYSASKDVKVTIGGCGG